jgi:hypothetical protein
MAEPTQSFRDFEYPGWEDQAVCANDDEQLSRITRQSITALLDAAGVHRGTRVLDVATAVESSRIFKAAVCGAWNPWIKPSR